MRPLPVPLLAAMLTLAAAALAQAPAPKPQEPADAKALKAANATEDPAQRLAALRRFLVTYPESKSVDYAHFEILNTLVKNFPEREADIDREAKYAVKHSGRMKNYEQGFIASVLVDRGPRPVDVAQAEKWARATAKHGEKLSEARFDKDQLKAYRKYKEPAPTAAALHRDYDSTQAQALIPLANVLVHKGDTTEAPPLLDRIYALDPSISKVSELRGILALNRHRDAEALADFEHAMLLGDLEDPWPAKMNELYRAAHGGSDAGFEAELDRDYAKLYPPPAPSAKQPSSGGHTVLLELFTGSGCGPCVGGDLAVETVLAAYPRSEVVALAFDQHIPEPDPLANEDSVARAKLYDANSTPNYFLDGVKLPFYGGGRSYAGELYAKIGTALDKEAARPSPVRLTLEAKPSGSTIVAAAAVSLPAKRAPAPPPEAAPAKPGQAPTPAAKPALPLPPKLVLNFALVEDDVSYSGENGVRFHRMVVRAMAPPQPLDLGRSADLRASFDPSAVSAKLHTYLTGFESKNDRFGKIKFRRLADTLDPARLAVAAWVEDSANHRVLQAAFQPLSAPSQVAGASR